MNRYLVTLVVVVALAGGIMLTVGEPPAIDMNQGGGFNDTQ